MRATFLFSGSMLLQLLQAVNRRVLPGGCAQSAALVSNEGATPVVDAMISLQERAVTTITRTSTTIDTTDCSSTETTLQTSSLPRTTAKEMDSDSLPLTTLPTATSTTANVRSSKSEESSSQRSASTTEIHLITATEESSTVTTWEYSTIVDTVTASGSITTVKPAISKSVLTELMAKTITQSVVETQPVQYLTEWLTVTQPGDATTIIPNANTEVPKSGDSVTVRPSNCANNTEFDSVDACGGNSHTSLRSQTGPSPYQEPTSSSSISICPSRIINPTYTPATALPTDYTWGCPPRHLCHPSHSAEDNGCNFEAGPPADTYYCAPHECIPSPKLLPPQHWGQPVWSQQVGRFNTSWGYFNLSPHEFGLNYSVFNDTDQNTSPINYRRDWTMQIPGKCYDECNDAMLEAEARGKMASLCDDDSAFMVLLRACRACIKTAHVSHVPAETLPEFQQFVFYCEQSHDHSSSSSSHDSTQTQRPSTAQSFIAISQPFDTSTGTRITRTHEYITPSLTGALGSASTHAPTKTPSRSLTYANAGPVNLSSRLWTLSLVLVVGI
ncbi:hypothetical protein NUU61_001325 [Penicillium alfredii]|uniref:Uncharacterized protein n=1 Tax=Penicillium alfredii TaxID=1506179 RepID=A0A9W9G4V7_9EURO|nr:uncharacterized protein NUU61_001325 [Penicillium alfredii]KAJ5111695.1 hypothetical protein NUU61_001325 [Penicillium alfredii]